MTELIEARSESLPGSDTEWSEFIPLGARGVALWLRDALAKVLSLRQLPGNWDGQGSPPLSTASAERARQIFCALELESAPAPQVFPVPGGGVQAEWHVGDRELELEFLPDGSIQFLRVELGEMTEGEVGERAVDETRRLLGWVMARPPKS